MSLSSVFCFLLLVISIAPWMKMIQRHHPLEIKHRPSGRPHVVQQDDVNISKDAVSVCLAAEYRLFITGIFLRRRNGKQPLTKNLSRNLTSWLSCIKSAIFHPWATWFSFHEERLDVELPPEQKRLPWAYLPILHLCFLCTCALLSTAAQQMTRIAASLLAPHHILVMRCSLWCWCAFDHRPPAETHSHIYRINKEPA